MTVLLLVCNMVMVNIKVSQYLELGFGLEFRLRVCDNISINP